MAIRENPSLPNRHTGYMATSGGGKSQALKQNKEVPRRGVSMLIWDPGRDHQANRYEDWAKFTAAVARAMKSRKGFRIAWSGQQDVETFEQFCALVWACLSGHRLFYVLIEELAAVQPSAGRAPPEFAKLCNQSRKFGCVLHWTTQRAPEISQTVIEQTENFYVGKPGRMITPQQADRLARVAGCGDKSKLMQLKPLQFYVANSEGTQLIQLKYKKI